MDGITVVHGEISDTLPRTSWPLKYLPVREKIYFAYITAAESQPWKSSAVHNIERYAKSSMQFSSSRQSGRRRPRKVSWTWRKDGKGERW